MPYSGDPANSTSDELRFLIGDTQDSPVLNDDEIAYLLAKYGSPQTASLEAIKLLIAKYNKPDLRIGSISITYSSVVQNLRDVLQNAKVTKTLGAIPVLFGGGATVIKQSSDPLTYEDGA